MGENNLQNLDPSYASRLFGLFNPITLRKAKIAYNFGLSEYNRVKVAWI